MDLKSKKVSEIKGTFTVPAYQRGYRWKKQQVMDLLDDIFDAGDNLCLQPVVVKAKGDDLWELIDGQQRLTTLYLIYRFMKDEGYKPRIDLPFSLEYETRPKSKEYLTRLDEESKNDNVDFYHIYHSYQAIKEWFGEDANQAQAKADRIYPKFDSKIFLIWYEVDEKTDAPGLFTRLNAGKIPLTNSELIKAQLLLAVKSANDPDDEREKRGKLKQIEIATQWDAMERELHNEEFWAFLTNVPGEGCPAHIELVFDLLADKKQEDKDEFHTFRWFEEKLDEKGEVDELWNKIQETFQTLRGWYEDRHLYHKVGYLIAEGKTELSRLVRESQGKTKSAFKNFLDNEIRGSLQGISCDDLSYENGADKDKIQRILRLFNVELFTQVKNSLERYPFSHDKSQKWSVEHIHAQNAESLRKEEAWREWLTEHRKALKEIAPENKELDGEIETALVKKEIGGETFRPLQETITTALSMKEDDFQVDLHGLGNLALMPLEENAALSNSVFAVKRKKLIEMDKAGCYIPIGTRWVFLKYYGDGQNCLHYWYKSDYDAYLKEIKTVLEDYLPKEEGQ